MTFLALKPGLFTNTGRDFAGEIWFEDFGLKPSESTRPVAWLHGETASTVARTARPHAGHKGRYGDVLVVGGQGIVPDGQGMAGAALLAARAAVHSGCGRTFLALLGAPSEHALSFDPVAPELMFRTPDAIFRSSLPEESVVVCGCGGGSAVERVLLELVRRSPTLVLDADGLNAIAREKPLQEQLRQRALRGWTTVLTPHPLEAARLLDSTTPAVMGDRLAAARELAQRYGALVVLKGSGSVLAGPGLSPRINASGNGLLSTAGSGDVLAGMVGAALALRPSKTQEGALLNVASAVYAHGQLADQWLNHRQLTPPLGGQPTLTASRLADAIQIQPSGY